MIRALCFMMLLLLLGCASKPDFYGPSPFPEWMQRALAHPNDNPAFHRFSLAYHGDAAGLHAYFADALRQANSSEIDVESGERLSFELETIVRHIGDRRSAAALAAEPSDVRSAVATFLHLSNTSAYPRTRKLLSDAPKIDFPVYRVYRGEPPKA